MNHLSAGPHVAQARLGGSCFFVRTATDADVAHIQEWVMVEYPHGGTGATRPAQLASREWTEPPEEREGMFQWRNGWDVSVLIDKESDQAVAYAVHDKESIESFHVRREFQRMGLGAMFARNVLWVEALRGSDGLLLSATCESVKVFWARLGFTVVEVQNDAAAKPKAWIMAKTFAKYRMAPGGSQSFPVTIQLTYNKFDTGQYVNIGEPYTGVGFVNPNAADQIWLVDDFVQHIPFVSHSIIKIRIMHGGEEVYHDILRTFADLQESPFGRHFVRIGRYAF